MNIDDRRKEISIELQKRGWVVVALEYFDMGGGIRAGLAESRPVPIRGEDAPLAGQELPRAMLDVSCRISFTSTPAGIAEELHQLALRAVCPPDGHPRLATDEQLAGASRTHIGYWSGAVLHMDTLQPEPHICRFCRQPVKGGYCACV